jgi:hypothetical protein
MSPRNNLAEDPRQRRNKYSVPNGTKLRGIVVEKATWLPARSAKFPVKCHPAQPLRRSIMLNLVPLYSVPRYPIRSDQFWQIVPPIPLQHGQNGPGRMIYPRSASRTVFSEIVILLPSGWRSAAEVSLDADVSCITWDHQIHLPGIDEKVISLGGDL